MIFSWTKINYGGSKMDKFKIITNAELTTITGGKKKSSGGAYHYYGNGVSCNRQKCRVDWSRSWYCIANRAAGAYATGGKATIGSC